MGPKMPVSLVCESQSDVSSAIRNSLSTGLNGNGSTHNNGLNSPSSEQNIQQQFVASAKRALLNHIDYEEVSDFNHSSVHDTLKTKYIVLKPPTSSSSSTSSTTSSTCSTATSTSTITSLNSHNNNNGKSMVNGVTTDKSNGTGNEKKGVELPTPKVVLFPRENVQIGWKSSERKWHVGAGMMNMGNACYLNSTLQALFHVPALANWLISDREHREMCENKTGIQGGCIVCAMAKTLIASQQTNSTPIKPVLVYSKLRLVCKHLVPGQQEDAHEFLRYLMEAMEKSYLARFPRHTQYDQFSKETTPINQILGGYLKTAVRCLACGHVSVTFQHFEDILLDIRKANTLEEALDLYFARERLEDMTYKCESCKKKVSATKQFSLERAPISLCIQLKRFSMVGNKLNKHIPIRLQLNLSKYSSKENQNQQLTYRLVSMVTHLGTSQHCGHYTAIGLTDAGSYYQFDDGYVRAISVQNVLSTNTYIIFYELDTSSPNRNTGQSVSLNQNMKLNGIKDDRSRPLSIFEDRLFGRNNGDTVTTTVTSGTTSKAFIGPVLPPTVVLNGHGNHETTSLSTSSSTFFSTSSSTSLSTSSLPSSSTSSLSILTNGNGQNASNGKVVQNGHIKPMAMGSKLVLPLKKNDASPVRIKLTSSGCRYINNASTSPITINDNDTENKTDCDTSTPEKLTKPVLPSMPKLDTPPDTLVCNEKTSNYTNCNGLTPSPSLSPSSSPSPKKTTTNSVVNGGTASTSALSTKNERNAPDDDSNSDSSIENYSKYCETAAAPAATVTTVATTAVVSGANHSQKLTRFPHDSQKTQLQPKTKLVPYPFNDDSEYDSGTESPPEVKTKAGTFHVTPINTLATTPRVVSDFMRNASTNPSPDVIAMKRENDVIAPVKTVASVAIMQNGNNGNKRPFDSRPNDTANKLKKYSHRGYGAVVTTWTGQKSNMEREVNEERKDELKRQQLDANDAEIDRGHKKKSNARTDFGRDNPGYNPFQEHQNNRNSWIVSNGHGAAGGTSANCHSNAGHPMKNKIFRQNPHKRHKSGGHKNGGGFNRNNTNRNFCGNSFGNNHFHRR